MTSRLRGILGSGLYVLLALLPLGAALAGDPFDTPRSWVIEFSIALGFIALALLTLQFALVSRLNAASRPFGGDALMQLHRRIAIVALMFIVVHAVLVSASTGLCSAWSPFHGSTASRTGALALWTTLTVVATSLFRRRIRLSYEAWQLIHLSGACLIVGSALFHVFGVAGYSRSPLMRWTLAGYTALFVTLLLRYRVVRPLMLWRRPWEIVSNRDLGASTRLLRVRPLGHQGLRFDAGQFAWLITGSTPLWSQQHPVSIASSAESASRDGVEFAIKALGDWSSTAVPALPPGRHVWIDGPFGAFTPAGKAAHGLVLIAGGIGIAPMRSMLMSMRDRADARPIVLFYAASDLSRAPFQDELERLRAELRLDVIYVLEGGRGSIVENSASHQGGRGREFPTIDPRPHVEEGFVTAEVLRRHLPHEFAEYEYFVCGPVPMIDSVERALTEIGVPARSVHTERFQMV